MVSKRLKVSDEGAVRLVAMENPPVNALDIEFTRDLVGLFKSLASDEKCRAVILTGFGTIFSAGLDLKALIGYDRSRQLELLTALGELLLETYSFPKPLVAAINGHVLAGGLVLALTCDHRVLTKEPVKLGLPETKVGVPYPEPAMTVVRSALDPVAARRLTLTAETLDPESALEWGVVDELASGEEVMAAALDRARELAELPAETYGTVKEQLRSGELKLLAGMLDEGFEAFVEHWLSVETEAAARKALRGG